MGLGKFLKSGVGLIGKVVHRASPFIGKALGAYGRTFVSAPVRKLAGSAADVAIKNMPDGRVKETLARINDAAQGHIRISDNPYAFTKPTIKGKVAQAVEKDD